MSSEDLLFWPRRRRHHRRRRFSPLHRRPYLLQQARGFFLGSWASGLRGVPAEKPARAAHASGVLCTTLVLQTAAARGKLTLRSALQQTLVCVWTSMSGHRSPAEATSAAQGDVRGAPRGTNLTSLVEGGKGPAGLLETPRRRDAPDPQAPEQWPAGASDGGGVGKGSESAFRCLMFHGGGLTTLVPRPGPLQPPGKRVLGHRVDTGPCGLLGGCRNAISSSYSSTRGFQPLRIVVGSVGHADSPAQAARAAAGEEAPPTQAHPPPTSAATEPVPEEPLQPRARAQGAEVEPASPPSGQRLRETDSASQPPRDPSRPRKRKVCLLRRCRPNEPLILPPSPQPGYPVTSEDLDAEKRAALEWINKVLEG